MTTENQDGDDDKPKAELVVRDAEAELAEAERKRKVALLRLHLAKLEAGEDVDLTALAKTESGGSAVAAPQGVEGVIGSLGSIAATMNRMGVEDETASDAKGGPGIKFQRHAGKVKNVQLDDKGRIVKVDFEPEEWPPRNEPF